MKKLIENYKYLRFTAVAIAVAILLASKIQAFEFEISPEIALHNSGIYEYCLEHGIESNGPQDKDNSPPDKD